MLECQHSIILLELLALGCHSNIIQFVRIKYSSEKESDRKSTSYMCLKMKKEDNLISPSMQVAATSDIIQPFHLHLWFLADTWQKKMQVLEGQHKKNPNEVIKSRVLLTSVWMSKRRMPKSELVTLNPFMDNAA